MPTNTPMPISTMASHSSEANEIINHFGPNALVKLNNYACSLEDLLLTALEKQKNLEQELATCREYIQRMQSVLHAAEDELNESSTILGNPQKLIEYFNAKYGPEAHISGPNSNN